MVLTPEALRTGVDESWAEEVRSLAREKDAVILAHNYQVPAIQDVAHYVGDSLELSRIAADVEESTIVFCGVHFMAETAKILSYDKKVLLPNLAAGCSLAASITADQLRQWKAEYPGSVVTMYVNTTAAVKAETDYCCTSANAVQIVNSIPADKEILFGPDMFLGAHVQRMTGRKNMHVWMGECHVHAGIEPSDIDKTFNEHPDADMLIHPECGCSAHALYLMGEGDLPEGRTHVLGTGGMIRHVQKSPGKEFIVATETGMLHRLRKENPEANFLAANELGVCEFMKAITPQNLLEALKNEQFEITVPADIAEKARLPIERMISIV